MAERRARESALTQGAGNARPSLPVWIAALFPILLAAALVAPELEREVFDTDESATLIAVGAGHLGPFSLAEALDYSVARWPGQGLGHVLAFWLWGHLVGWSEFAMRALPWLLGALTLAWLYRLGRELAGARVAHAATLLLATSVIFLTHMNVARSYAVVMLFAAIAIWAYWRVALAKRPPRRGDCIALLAGAAGLLYAHYFAALLLPALAMIHLLFAGVIARRRWWTAALLLALALFLAAPQLWDLYSGVQANLAREWLHRKALGYSEVVSLFVRYLGNGLLVPGPPLNSLIVPALLLPVVFLALRRRLRRQLPGPALYPGLAAGLHLTLLLGANQWLRVLEPTRIRYLAALWPAAMLLIAVGLHRLLRHRGRFTLPLALALIALPGALDFHRQGELVRHSWSWRESPVSIPMMRVLAREGGPRDLLLVDMRAFRHEYRTHEFYTGAWQDRRAFLWPEKAPEDLAARARAHRTVWLLYLNASGKEKLLVDAIIERLRREGWVAHQALHEDEVSLEQFLSPLATGAVLDFERQIRLSGFRVDMRDERLEVRAGLRSADDYLLAHYSLALHVIDPRTGQRLAQGDVGVGPGSFVTLHSVMDLSALPPGDYEVHVALYDWQTGARLSARDLASDLVSDMHVLHTFRIGIAP